MKILKREILLLLLLIAVAFTFRWFLTNQVLVTLRLSFMLSHLMRLKAVLFYPILV